MDILRIATSGSVDDGKSTLIGRLLYETNHVPKDKIEQLRIDSAKRGLDFTDLSLLTDGLISEREQGITIDVAHVYFATSRRKYIIADTPGHEEYTRNMVTGASQSDVAIVLIDARKGVLSQTKRHLSIAQLLNLEQVIVAINKMDLVDYSEATFNSLCLQVKRSAEELKINVPIQFIPVSAFEGEGVTHFTGKMPWFEGPDLLTMLDDFQPAERNEQAFRFNVQSVIRPKSGEFKDYRAYTGIVQNGMVEAGMKVRNAQTEQLASIRSVEKWGTSIQQSGPDQAITIQLNEDIDLSRGDLLVESNDPIRLKNQFSAQLCWMSQQRVAARQKFILQLGTASTRVIIERIENVLNLENAQRKADTSLNLNDIGKVDFKTASPIVTDPFVNTRKHGGFILIDPSTNSTVGAGFMAE